MRLLPLLLLLPLSCLLGCASTPGPLPAQEEARLLWEAGQKEPAIELLEKSLAATPGDARAHRLLGSLLHDVGRTDGALEHFQRAAQLEPDAYASQYGTGALLSQLERYDEARPSLERALELRPGDVPALVQLAENAFHAGRYADCSSRFDEVIGVLDRRVGLRESDLAVAATSLERRNVCRKRAAKAS